ncbi:MAG: ArsR/SmtB family transcription factor [Planctomycetota bacterium]|jgi:ArsR family transcriptional regulator
MVTSVEHRPGLSSWEPPVRQPVETRSADLAVESVDAAQPAEPVAEEAAASSEEDGRRDREDVLSVARALSDGSRLSIVSWLLDDAELNVKELCSRLKQSQPAVSHHLKLLKDLNILRMRRDGKHNFYSLKNDHAGLVRRLLLV